MSGTITTISTLVTSTVDPGNGTYASYLTITNTGSILPSAVGGQGVYGGPGIGNVSILNAGTIESGPNGGSQPSVGVYLSDGGVVTNSGAASVIYGFADGIKIGQSSGTVVNDGTIAGSQSDGIYLSNGGFVSNTGPQSTIYSQLFGVNIVNSPGTVENNGTITGKYGFGISLAKGGTVTNSGTIFSEGSAVVLGSDGNNLLIVDPGAKFYGAVYGSSFASNTLELAAGAGAGTLAYIGSQFTNFNNIVFDTGASWTLSGDTAGLASGETIQGFASTDTIDLTDFAASSETLVSGTELVLGNGVTSETLNFSDFSGVGFSISADGNGGTIIEEVTCYVEGTRIATAAGEIPVEALEIGCQVQTLHAGLRKIKWIGKRGYAAPFANHEKVLPVCIKANAIATNVPVRDLFVSPGHAICIDGALIHASRLVNGVSIFQLSRVERLMYYHIELEGHEIVFAENCPAETYMGEYFRRQFHNAAEFERLYPGEVAPEAMCLPRLESGFHLRAIQQRIASRAGIAEAAELGGLQGYIDQIAPYVVSGWARNVAVTEEPVCLDIFSDGQRVGRVLANLFRQDVRDAGFGSGFYGFEFLLPSEANGFITVARASDGAALPLANEARAAA